MEVKFTVYGDPKPQARHRSTKSGHNYDPSAAKKKSFAQVIQEYRPEKPFEGPLMIMLKFYFRRPNAHYKSGNRERGLKENAPILYTSKSRNDWDNLGKLVCDAMNGIMYLDDGQIAKAGVMKLYGKPRTEVTIKEI